MQQINKNDIGTLLYLDILSDKLLIEEKIKLFNKKYNKSLSAIEKQINHTKTENLELWDDYIEWKAYLDFLSDINKKIDDIKNGLFQVA